MAPAKSPGRVRCRQACAFVAVAALFQLVPAVTGPFVSSAQASTGPTTVVPVTGFGGYRWWGDVSEVGAKWRVPRISAKSPPGCSAIWIGAQSSTGNPPFIQVGTLEDETATGAATYQVFWSDTGFDYYPQRLAAVRPGDTVSFVLQRRPTGWRISADDLTSGHLVTRNSHYTSLGSFDQAEWVVEDPPASNIASTDLPFPVMSTVNFGDLSVNTSTPRLGLANGETLTTSNAMYFVPTTVHADGFKLMAAVGAARRYLVDAARIDEAGASFQVQVAAWRGKSYVRKLLATADLEVAFRRFGSSVTVQRWPSRARSSMALLATASRRAARALVTWGASGFSLKDAAWAEFRYDEDLLDSCATAARATLGLPPG